MTTDRQPMNPIAWLGLLIVFCNPPDHGQALADMAPMVDELERFPGWTLCRASCRAVEAHERRRAVPSLSEIERPLMGWIERNSDPCVEAHQHSLRIGLTQRMLGA